MSPFKRVSKVQIPTSLLQRLVTVNTAIVILALVLISALVFIKEYSISIERQKNSLSSMAIIITDRLTGVMAFEDYDLARKNINSLRLNENILTACLYDIDHNLVTKFNRHSNQDEFCTKNSNITTSLMVDQPIMLNDQALGRLVLYADPKLFWEHQIGMSLFLLLVGTLCYVFTWLLSKRYFRKETKSLLKLAATAREISKTGNYEIRVTAGENPAREISNLVNSFNELLEIVENHRSQLEDMINIRTAQLNEEKKKVEKISEAKSEFLAKLNHDIRTPLTSILGYTELIKNGDTVHDKNIHHLDAILRNAEFVSELVNGLLSLAKLESTDLAVKAAPFNINTILESIKQTFEPLAERKNLTLSLNTLSLEENWLEGDSLKLHQVLNNLLDNAIKFTKQGSVQLSVTQRRKDQETVIIKFKITDSGIGISNTKIRDIFDDYVQIGSDTQLLTGAGLGLAIAKKLVNAMDGTISVRQNSQGGSEFSIEIPFKPSSKLSPGPAGKENHTAQIKSLLHDFSPILVIDDDPNCREIVSEILLSQQPQCTIIHASTFMEAINLYHERQPKLVFTDIELPDGNGYELAKEIKQYHGNTLIVAISAYHTIDEYGKTGNRCFNHLIAKPFHKQNLLDTLREIVEKIEPL